MIFEDVIKKLINKINNFLRVGIVGGVGYEYPLDAWHYLKKGQRWNVILSYTSNLAASSSYTSTGILAQDGSMNNYTEIRLHLHQEGSTNTTVKIQQSSDNSTWYDIPNQSATLTSNGDTTVKADVYRPYIRIVEENNDSSNAQTTNNLYVVLL